MAAWCSIASKRLFFSATALSASKAYASRAITGSQGAQDDITINGTIVKFKEHDELILEDNLGRITVEYPDKHLRRNLSVGEKVLAHGNLRQDSDGQRLLIADEIETPDSSKPKGDSDEIKKPKYISANESTTTSAARANKTNQ